MRRWIVFCNFFSCLIVVETFTADDHHRNGNEICNTHGGLFSQDYFKTNNGAFFKKSDQLLDGESVWIGGLAVYSTLNFVNFEGCFVVTSLQDHGEFPSPPVINIHHCTTTCKYKYPLGKFIGLKSNRCLCLSDFNGFQRIDNAKCDQFQPYNLKYISNSSERISVFSLVDHELFAWDPQGSGIKQCVYAKKIVNQVYYTTNSCYNTNADGFVCSQFQTKIINDALCFEPNVCVVQNNSSWLQAKDQCLNYTGLLHRQIFPDHIKYLNSTKKYWIGMFRSFDLVPYSPSVQAFQTACLAATRVGDKLLLDPDNCEEKKKFLCADGHLVDPYREEKTISTTLSISITLESNMTTPKDSNHSDLYITTFVSIGIVLIAVITVIYFVHRIKAGKSSRQRLSSSTSASGEHEGKIEAVDVGSTTEPMINDAEKTDKGPKPSKPSRRTIRQSSKHSNYENIKMAYGKLTKNVEQCNDNQDYDRVNLKGIKVNVSKQTQPETCEATIYDHTFQTDEQEDYDTCTLKSSKSLHKSTDTTYNKVGERLERDDESTVRTITDSDQKLTDYSAVVLQETCNKSE